MIAFKYFTSNVRDLILAGSVKLSSLGYFRTLEQRQIGGKNEGTDRRITSLKLIGKGQGPTIKHTDGLRVITGINKSSDAPLTVKNLEALEHEDALVYSTTTFRNDDYWLKEEEPAFDASIEITDLDLLARRLEGEIKKLCPSN